MMHEKISAHHLERKAILYVRQSSAHQVLHNRESSALQYAMRDRLKALGWSQMGGLPKQLHLKCGTFECLYIITLMLSLLIQSRCGQDRKFCRSRR